ncbi:MAG: mRNA surveillance protein pelota [Candidatus Thorarchaeota archaeon]|nr:mRNA surveillance protein pelota [Candidatus Thorarchaeota archaeon]MCK5238756.1 mRNA surveillance protein pelota [Candidatus Thorarchaeota archaeon]
MKVVKRILKEGKVKIKIEFLNDLWTCYNVVVPKDIVVSRTTRRVRVGDDDGRKQESVRKPMTLTIKVEDVSFHAFSNRVRLKGKVLEGPSDYVTSGSYHTINIETGDTLTIIKPDRGWPKYMLDRLNEAEKAGKSPIALLVTIEDGVAELLLAADFGIREAVRVRTTISRKRGTQKDHDTSMREFFSNVTVALRSQLEQHEIGLIIVAGPGFVKDHYKEHLLSADIKNLPSVISESINSIGIPGAKEILFRGIISQAVEGIKLETETQLVESIIEHIAKDDGLAAYGPDEVKKAVQFGAVEDLLVTDKRLREGDNKYRRWMDQLIRDTEKARGSFHLVSTEHPAGDQLQNLSGIAAVLRFRIDR